MKRFLPVVCSLALVALVAFAAEMRTAVLDASTTGGVAPKPYSSQLQRHATYTLQCTGESCYRLAPSLQSDGGLPVDCAQDFIVAAKAGHDIETGTNTYLSVGAVADGGTADCRLFFKTKNR